METRAVKHIGKGVGRRDWGYAPPASDSVTKDIVDKYYEKVKEHEIDELTKAIQSPEDRLKELEDEMKRIQKEIDELLEEETKVPVRGFGGKAHKK